MTTYLMLLFGNTRSGSVPDDGPGTLNYAWSWSPGDIQEGTYNPRSRSMIIVVFRFQIRSLSVLTVHLQR